jgi:uncharacterized OB-fold protein
MASDFPLPDTEHPLTRPFWEAAARGELVVPRCAACARFVWYPRERCPGCERDALSWQPVSGRARLFSFAIVRRPLFPAFAELVPYATGLAALDEDPSVRIVTRIVDCELDALRVELPLRAVFRPLRFPGLAREVVAPLFAPAV